MSDPGWQPVGTITQAVLRAIARGDAVRAAAFAKWAAAEAYGPPAPSGSVDGKRLTLVYRL